MAGMGNGKGMTAGLQPWARPIRGGPRRPQPTPASAGPPIAPPVPTDIPQSLPVPTPVPDDPTPTGEESGPPTAMGPTGAGGLGAGGAFGYPMDTSAGDFRQGLGKRIPPALAALLQGLRY